MHKTMIESRDREAGSVTSETTINGETAMAMTGTSVTATTTTTTKSRPIRKSSSRSDSRTVSPKSCYVGTTYSIGNTHFVDKRGLYITRMLDYEILTTEDFSDFASYAPKSLRRAISSRWRYAVHVSYGTLPSITRDLLYARVVGGQILAYKYLECSIEGNESVYYGFLPSIDNYAVQEDTHSTCRFLMQAIYPRLLYVHLTRTAPCSCSSDCWYWKTTLSDALTEHTFCGKRIPWSRLYVIMGELDVTCNETVDAKEPRECPVCAQCFECSLGARYCRTHRVCKHKQAASRSDALRSSELASFIPKPCKRLKKQ